MPSDFLSYPLIFWCIVSKLLASFRIELCTTTSVLAENAFFLTYTFYHMQSFLQENSGGIYGLSIRNKIDCGLSTMQNLQRLCSITNRQPEHPHKRRLFSFLLHRSLLICKLPFILSAHGTYYLPGRSRRMDLYAC